MAKTVVTGSSSYATFTDWRKYTDVNTIADLVADDNARPDVSTLATNANVLEILLAASGDVEMACLLGGKYTPTDLAALTGNSAAALRRIVCWRATGLAWQRRPRSQDQRPHYVEEVESILNELANGRKIFGFQEAMDAGHAQVEVDDKSDVETRRLATYQARSLFGTRGNRMPV